MSEYQTELQNYKRLYLKSEMGIKYTQPVLVWMGIQQELQIVFFLQQCVPAFTTDPLYRRVSGPVCNPTGPLRSAWEKL